MGIAGRFAESRKAISPESCLPEKIIRTLTFLSAHSPYYSSVLKKISHKAPEFWTWEMFKTLPLTTKSDLARNNDKFLCVKPSQIRDWCSTSGTTGSPVYIGLTSADLRRLAANESWTFRMAGLRKGDVLQIMITLDKRFMAGLAYWLGGMRRGISVIRAGPGMVPVQWQIMQERKTTALLAVPSFLPTLIDYAEANHLALDTLSVHTLIAVGEPTLNEDGSLNTLASTIKARWPLKIVSTYASTEMQTAFTECDEGKGLHLQDKLLFAEVLDERGKDVPDGSEGQLVFTHLGVQGMPLLRYATGDIVKVWYSPCPCGLNSLRIGPVKGRLQQRLKINGTTVYPSQYVQLLNNLGLSQNFQLVISKEHAHDHLEIHISDISVVQDRDTFENYLKIQIKNHCLPIPVIKWKNTQNLRKQMFAENSRKPIVVFDKRFQDKI